MCSRFIPALVAGLLTVISAAPAHADPTSNSDGDGAAASSRDLDYDHVSGRGRVRPGRRNFGNLRVGGNSFNQGSHPDLCLELSPLRFLSFEACGTGSGFLHDDPDPEMAHFAAKWRIGMFPTSFGWLSPQVSAGFAELQIDRDEGGFVFDGVSPSRGSTAGAEVGFSLQAMFALSPGWEWILEVKLAAAYLPYAPDLLRPHDTLQPTLTFSGGVGF